MAVVLYPIGELFYFSIRYISIELPDGTNVVLNSASQLSFLNNFGENGRRVQLNGEAYFKVAHDEKCAFIVQVGRYIKRSTEYFHFQIGCRH